MIGDHPAMWGVFHGLTKMKDYSTDTMDLEDPDYPLVWEDELDRMGPFASFGDLARHFEKAPKQETPQKQFLSDYLMTQGFVMRRDANKNGNNKGN